MNMFIAFKRVPAYFTGVLGCELHVWRERAQALRACALVVMFAACTATAQPGLVPGVPDPHARPLRSSSARSVNMPVELARPLSGCAGLEVTWATGGSGDLGYNVIIQAIVEDLDGDGVIRADAGYYALYAGANEVSDLTVSFYQDDVLLVSYANITAGSVSYPFLYFEWVIGSPELAAFDLGEDPGIYCFGGQGVTNAPGFYFSDSINARGGTLGAFDSDSCVIADTELVYTSPALSTSLVGLDVNGSLVYLGRESVLEAYEVSDPENPMLLGISDPSPSAISFRGRVEAGSAVAIVALTTVGLDFYDIRDPANPTRFGFGFSDGFNLEREGDTAYTLGLGGVLSAYDLGTVTTSSIGFLPNVLNPVDMVVENGYVFVTVRGSSFGVKTYDVRDPTAMQFVSEFVDLDEPQIVGVANGVLCYWTLAGDTLKVLDVRDPVNPVQVGTLSIAPNTFTGDIAMRGSHAYIGVGEEIWQIDLSDPSNPAVSEQYPGSSRRNKLDNGVLYSLDSEWRAHELASQLGTESVPGEAAAVSMADEYDVAYVANGSAGLSVLDVRAPGNPWPLGTTAPFDAFDVVHEGRYAFAAGGPDGLRVIDADDPESPSLAATLPFLDAVGRLAIEDDIVLAAAGSAGLRLVDVSTPAAPLERGALDVFDASDVAVQDGLACVVGDDAGGTLWVVDVSDADSPAVLASVPTAFLPEGVALRDGYACIVGAGGLEVVDITNPVSPIPQGRVTLPDGMSRVSFAYGLAIATSPASGMAVIDVATDPCVPTVLGSWQTSGGAGGIAVQGGVTLVAAATGGVEILDLARCFESGADTDGNGTPDYREPVQNRDQGTGYGTLQAALNGAADGDHIEIASGVLEEDGVVFPVGIDVNVCGAGVGRTIIDGGGGSDQSPIFSFESTFQTPATVISDLTLRNGVNTTVTGGGAVRSSGSSPRFERVRFLDNGGPDSVNGAAHVVATNSSSIAIEHCEFRGGFDAYDAVGASNATLVMTGCLVAENATTEAVVHSGTGTIEMTNCTVLGDDTSLGVALASFTVQLNVRNSIVLGTTPTFGSGSIVLNHCLTPGAGGNGNIDGAASFVNRSNGDYRLAPGSLGIDAGSNPLAVPSDLAIDLGGDQRFTDDPATPDTGVGPAPVIDIGAYEFQPPVVPRCPADLAGEANAPDGLLNLDDVNAFVAAFLDAAPAADLNQDGQINLDDIGLFVEWFLTGCS